MSTTCAYCSQEMSPGTGCTQQTYDDFPDGRSRARLEHSGDVNCHDCNVAPGQLHHPGCDGEQCPACGGQAIACECFDEANYEDEEMDHA